MTGVIRAEGGAVKSAGRDVEEMEEEEGDGDDGGNGDGKELVGAGVGKARGAKKPKI